MNHQTGSITFKGVRVYDALFVKDKAPTFFVGCSATVLRVIEKQNIPTDQYFFASYGKVGYKECRVDYKGRKLLINADWVDTNVPGFKTPHDAPPAAKPAKNYQPAPPILYLDESEMFRDATDHIVEMEVRGERHWKKIWFKARDVEKMLEMTDISAVLAHKASSYEVGKDYDTFSLQPLPVNYSEGVKKPVNKNELAMFLSYAGLVRILITRRHPIAEKFQDWAFEKLFTLQYGTQVAKQELVADVLGVTPKALKAVLNTNVSTMPAIYLFHLGSVKDLRSSLNIPDRFEDNSTVYKFGRSDNLHRRTGDHETAFGRLANVNLRLKHHVYIDPVFTTEAEADIRKYFTDVDWVLPHMQYTELAIVPSKLECMVREKFIMIGKSYAGKLDDLQKQLAAEQRRCDDLRQEMQSKSDLHNTIVKEKDLRIAEQARFAQEIQVQYEARIRAVEELNTAYKELVLRKH
jgi:hypothetical protein